MKRCFQLFIPVTFLILIFTKASYAQEDHHFSLQQCIDYAMQHQTQIKSSEIDLETTNAKNAEITGMALPQISASGSLQYLPAIPTQFIPDFISPAVYGVLIKENVLPADTKVPQPGMFPVAFGTKYSATGSISINQTLFEGSLLVALQAKKTLIELSKKSLQQSKRDVRVSVSKAYYSLLISKKQLDLTNTNIERISKLLHDTKIMYQNGFAEQLDVDRVQVQLNNLETAKVNLINMLAVGDQLLKFQMGMPLNELLTPTDTLSTTDLVGALRDSSGFEYNNRIEYSLLQTQKKANEYNLKRYKMGYLPTVSAFMNYGKNAGRDEFNFLKSNEPWFTTWIVGLNVNVPIFDGFQRKNQVKEARLAVEKNNIQLEGLKQSINLQISQSESTLQNDIINLNSQEGNMKLAESVYEAAKKKYEAGVGSNLEVVNAESDLKQAQTNYFSALYDAIIAKIDYEESLGKI
ncbi:MAG: TolC family protein [Chitinophagaceae bacterium]|jgi:outer membrane protein TolC|nr:MAG: TolC family protein [Chitinophagaceae bacterium]